MMNPPTLKVAGTADQLGEVGVPVPGHEWQEAQSSVPATSVYVL
jgi:hypothetical protein